MISQNLASPSNPTSPNTPQSLTQSSAAALSNPKSENPGPAAHRSLGPTSPQLKSGQPSVEEEGDTTLDEAEQHMADENTPLLGDSQHAHFRDERPISGWRALPKRCSSIAIGTLRLVIATVSAPYRYLIACFYDEEGRFSPILPLVSIYRLFVPRKKRRGYEYTPEKETPLSSDFRRTPEEKRPFKQSKKPPSIASSATAVASDSEFDEKSVRAVDLSKPRSRSSMSSSGDEISPGRRSIRIKLHNDEMIKRRRQQQADAAFRANTSKEDVKEVVAASLKSPSSPGASKLTKFPRAAPVPPRPLIPRRQPSYTNASSHGPHQKTLIIDLDETLIHSHSKGGRFATGHMVEVKMQHAVGVGGQYLGPQIPILYYVHKRPHCDEFLRKVSKWYNLVIFTASVQEYADPVIDWLELERKYFTGRYYRQHCTHRNGAYIKDLSQVEPDLSRVMIVDNSPVSYIFHEDNAIPIEGWISDPTDNDLLNLIPFLEGLQHATDVRALLALRLGQPQVDGS